MLPFTNIQAGPSPYLSLTVFASSTMMDVMAVLRFLFDDPGDGYTKSTAHTIDD